MSKPSRWQNTPDAFFREGLKPYHVTWTAYCQELGVDRNSLKHYLFNFRLGLYREIRRTIDENSLALARDQRAQTEEIARQRLEEAERLNDVTTPEGREVEGLKAQAKALREENKRLRGHVVVQEDLFERVAAELREPRPIPKLKFSRAKGKRRRDVILPLFDMQYGALVRSSDTLGEIGGFDARVFEARLKKYVGAVTDSLSDYSDGHSLEHLVFVLGGDLVEGDDVFAGQPWQLEMDPVEQVVNLEPLLCWALLEIVDAFVNELGGKSVNLLGILGNHGRVGGKRAGARPSTYSWDYLLLKILERSLSRVPWNTFAIEPSGACYFDSRGHTFAVIHGDEVKSWGGLPFYGLTRHDAKMVRTLGTVFDYLLLGHHHQPANIPIGYGEHIMSGNWVGATNLSRFVGSNTPSQAVLYVSEEYGASDRSLIYLDAVRKPQPVIHQTA